MKIFLRGWWLLAFLLAACSTLPPAPPKPKQKPRAAGQAPAGLRFQLSPANAGSDASQTQPKATPTPLTEAELQPLLNRLPALKARPEDRQAFALREGSKPPPRTAKTLTQPFPPKETRGGPPPLPKNLPLEVLNVSPRGAVDMAPHLQITFNQPMVPLTGLQDLEAKGVPVKLTPQPKGKWRWLGTQTLMFAPDLRFPMATEYVLEIPAGLASASGARLKASQKLTFTTPTLSLEQSSPSGGGQILKPMLFMRFNQDIEPAYVARLVRLSSDGPVPELRQATREEVSNDDQLQNLIHNAGQRWLALMPTQDLQPGHTYTVQLPKGMPSKEGPLLTSQDQSFSFATYDPLRLESKTTESYLKQPWYASFNNPLDEEKFDPNWVTVTPDLPGLRVQANGGSIIIGGTAKGRSEYRVKINGALLDRFGQRLGHEQQFTVKISPPEPSFTPPAQQFTVLDPKGPRQVICRAVNYPKVRVTAWKVEADDWPAYLQWLQTHGQNLKDHPKEPPGRKLIDTTVETRLPQDQEGEVPIDVSAALSGNHGHFILRLDPEPQKYHEEWRRQVYYGWFQATDLGLDCVSDGKEMLAWVSDLASGEPRQGAQVQLWPSQAGSLSDSQGLARFSLPPSAQLLIARQGDDVAILPRDFYYWGSSQWNPSAGGDATLWHVLDDRKLYKPGETVHIKGWARVNQYGPEGDLVRSPMKSLNYNVYDSQGNEIAKGQAPVGGVGGFNFHFTLPKTVNLGHTRVVLQADSGGSTSHSFQVEEFRRPEFEVSAEASPSSSQIGSSSVLTATASYFSGGPLNNAKVDWSVSSTPTSYSPPGWEGYTFGTWTPWWSYRCWWSEGEYALPEAQSNHTTQQTRTDSKGKSGLKVDFLSVDPPRPHSLSAQATVQDVNRQVWTSQTSVLVHPASVYIGLKSETTFVEKGQSLKLSMVLSDLDGKAVAGRPVYIKSYRLDWDDLGRKREADVREQVITSESQPKSFEVSTGEGGTYQIEARVQEEGNRSNYSQLTLWVAGGKQRPATHVAQEPITLVPGKQEYQAGDTAEVLVQAPFAPAELLVTVRRNGLAKVERIQAKSGSTTLKIPLQEYQIPGLNVQVDAVGSKLREDGKTRRPAYASGALTLNISSKPRQLTVALKPAQAKLEPGGKTTLSVSLKDHLGKPVQGEVTVIMVDESVLALTGYNPADPLGSFLPLRGADCVDHHLRQYLTLSEMPEDVARNKQSRYRGAQADGVADDVLPTYANEEGLLDGAPSGGRAAVYDKTTESKRPMAAPAPSMEATSAPPPPIKLRTNFAALALFVPSLPTGADGTASVNVTLPDNLTRYRIIGLAAANVKQFGKGESSLVARQPLMVRPSAPRFLNFGDKFEMPVLLQNQTDQAMRVSLGCRATNAKVNQKTAAGYSIEVPANDRLEVRIPCAADQAGTARFQFAASSGSAADAAEISLPVWTPSTTEAFATYGILDGNGATRQPIERPSKVWPQFGGLTVTTSSTALSELTDAFLYLTSYPFECSEQISSRMLAAAALKDVLYAFDVPGLASPADLKAAMERDLERLRVQQNDDGGWDYWVRGEPSVPYLSVHVAHTLVRVKEKGFTVNDSMLQQALAYLDQIELHIPSDYPDSCKRSIRAYALYTLNLAGRPNIGKARQLIKETGLENTEAVGWLLPTLAKDPASRATVDEIYRYLDNHSTQTAATAQFTAGYSDNGYLVLYSDRRDDGLLLEAMITTRPNHPLIPKLVRGLLDHRTAGHWANTQENCWVLLALDRYFHQYESVTPNFVASLWLGDKFAGEQAFRGRDKDEKELKVPMSQLTGPLTLDKQGPGRLYYRIGLNYAPEDLKMPPADYGFSVQRRYEAIGDNRDVSRDADGTWHIKAGADLKVTVTMQAPSRRYHVALVDPLPAGLEAVNPALLGSGDRSRAPANRGDGWWMMYWYQHTNMRDERVEAFTQLLWEGVYTYAYVARATTPGNFVVPPAKAEEMYHPETFGRSGTDRVIVE